MSQSPPPAAEPDAGDDSKPAAPHSNGAAGLGPLSPRWSRVAVAALALLAGGMIFAVWPSHADPAQSAAAPAVSAIPAASPQAAVASPAATPSAMASSSASPTTTPVAEGAAVTGLIENVDGLPNTVVATGDGAVFGDPSAGVITYTVETDQSLAGELPALLATVEQALGNTEKGWTAYGSHALQRVGSTDMASIRIVLATPAVVDEACARSGLDTASMYSCWDGAHTMLNSDRWFHATPEFTDLNVYRTYLVNHEFGHGLGYDHQYCPGPGEVAPVMQQQSISLQGCQANGWPIP